MIQTLKKIFDFSGSMRDTLKRCVLFSVVHSIFDMFQMGALALVFAGIINGLSQTTVWAALGMMIFSIIGRILCSYASDFGQVKTGYFMCAEKRIHVGDRIKYMPMGYFNDHSLGALTSTVTTTMGEIENNASSVLSELLNGFFYTLILSIVLLFVDWRIGLLVLLGAVLFLWCNAQMQKKSKEISPLRQQAQENLVGAVLEYIQGLLVVKAYHLDRQSNQKIKNTIRDSKEKNLKLEHVFLPYGILQSVILQMMSTVVILSSIYFYLSGTMTLVVCLLMIVASFLIYNQLEKAGEKSFALQILDSSMDNVNKIDKVPVMDGQGKELRPEHFDIEFNHVDFSFAQRKILSDINLLIPEKSTTAIVGPSGSGKSTLCSLIARFWDVDTGSIRIGGHDVREYKLDSLLANISIVFQNVYLFADTIENNIKFGNPDATREEVIAAAKKACCHDFISALPNGYHTVIGENGATLSGGEKQRISIARAILKDAPIIILDEATSSVDPENESQLQKAIEELTKDKTILMIAHRLKTVRHADQIIVVADGGIAQRGTHEELIQQPGIYSDFVGVRKKAIGWKLHE